MRTPPTSSSIPPIQICGFDAKSAVVPSGGMPPCHPRILFAPIWKNRNPVTTRSRANAARESRSKSIGAPSSGAQGDPRMRARQARVETKAGRRAGRAGRGSVRRSGHVEAEAEPVVALVALADAGRRVDRALDEEGVSAAEPGGGPQVDVPRGAGPQRGERLALAERRRGEV